MQQILIFLAQVRIKESKVRDFVVKKLIWYYFGLLANGGNYWEEWCPYHIVGECRFGEQCLMVHGVKCDYCGEFCLHPFDTIQRDKHLKVRNSCMIQI